VRSQALNSLRAPWYELRQFEALPAWVEAAVDPDLVGATLMATVPELARGAPAFRGCRITRPRLQESRWRVRYLVTVAGSDGVPRCIPLVGELVPPGMPPLRGERESAGFGSSGWRCLLPDLGMHLSSEPPDAALPALDSFTDPQQARLLLEAAMQAGGPALASVRIVSARPEVVRYHPGIRCTIRYQLDFPPDAAGRGWPDVVVAKLYEGELGRHAYGGMRALWSSPLSRGTVVHIAQPLAYLSDLRVLVQGPVREEQTLAERLGAALATGTVAARTADVEGTAAGLVALHRSGVGYGPHVTLAGELDKVRMALHDLSVAVPRLTGAAEPLLARIEELDAVHPTDPAVPTHRSFRPAQVLLWHGQIGFIDFDGLCQAEPALDVGLFRATTLSTAAAQQRRSKGASNQPVDPNRLAELSELCDAFSQRYQASLPISPTRVALWETLHLFTQVLHCWTKIRPHRLEASMALLEHHLSTSAPG